MTRNDPSNSPELPIDSRVFRDDRTAGAGGFPSLSHGWRDDGNGIGGMRATRRARRCAEDDASGLGKGADFFYVGGGEVVFGGAVEDCLQVVRSGAEVFFYFCGDVSFGGDGVVVGVENFELDAAVVDRRTFEAIEIAIGGIADFVEDAVDDAALRGTNVGGGRASSDFLVEDEFVVHEPGGAIFGYVAGAGTHLRGIHVACVCKIPDLCHGLPMVREF